MTYSVYLETKITDDETDNEIASISRLYEVESLAKLAEVNAHFGKVAAVAVEGEELGMEGE